MVGEFTAAGEIAGGALLGRAVEPRAGEHGAGDAHGEGAGGLCLNCGTRRAGAFCHHCGQSGHTHRTMAAIGHDLLHSVLHFDGKTWRTLPLLTFRPGELTRRYIDGERARFVSPLAIFLFSVFLMFAVLGSLPGWSFGRSDLLNPGVAAGMAQARTKLAEEKARARRELQESSARLAKERQDPAPDARRIARLEQRVADARGAVAGLTEAERMLPKTGSGMAGLGAGLAAGPTAGGASVGGSRITLAGKRDNWLDAKWQHAKENPELLLYKLKSSAYKFSWALIPISLPFIWLLFPLRRGVGMYDHAVFATYSLTFMSLLAITLAVLGATIVPGWMCIVAALLIPPFHLYKQLKGTYRLGRLGTLWRLFWLLNFTALTTGLFAIVLLYLGLG